MISWIALGLSVVSSCLTIGTIIWVKRWSPIELEDLYDGLLEFNDANGMTFKPEDELD